MWGAIRMILVLFMNIDDITDYMCDSKYPRSIATWVNSINIKSIEIYFMKLWKQLKQYFKIRFVTKFVAYFATVFALEFFYFYCFNLNKS